MMYRFCADFLASIVAQDNAHAGEHDHQILQILINCYICVMLLKFLGFYNIINYFLSYL